MHKRNFRKAGDILRLPGYRLMPEIPGLLQKGALIVIVKVKIFNVWKL